MEKLRMFLDTYVHIGIHPSKYPYIYAYSHPSKKHDNEKNSA